MTTTRSLCARLRETLVAQTRKLRKKKSRNVHLACGLSVLLACSACNPKSSMDVSMDPTPSARPTGLDPNTPYSQWWTDKPALFNLSKEVKLAIPPQYQQFWYQKDQVKRLPYDINKIPVGGLVGFAFFLPDFTGYTPQNYLRDFDEDRVDVVNVEPQGLGQEVPGAPGLYPPNQLQNTRELPYLARKSPVYGLECYGKPQEESDLLSCYGIANETTARMISLRGHLPPYPSWMVFPTIQAHYFSTELGGVRILWRTHAKNLPRWKEIDQQVWKFIKAWNLASPEVSTAK